MYRKFEKQRTIKTTCHFLRLMRSSAGRNKPGFGLNVAICILNEDLHARPNHKDRETCEYSTRRFTYTIRPNRFSTIKSPTDTLINIRASIFNEPIKHNMSYIGIRSENISIRHGTQMTFPRMVLFIKNSVAFDTIRVN